MSGQQPPQWGPPGMPPNAAQNMPNQGPPKPGMPPARPPMNNFVNQPGMPPMPNMTPAGPYPGGPGPGMRPPMPVTPYSQHNNVQTGIRPSGLPQASVPRNNSAPDMYNAPPTGPPSMRPMLSSPLVNGSTHYKGQPSTVPPTVRPPMPQMNGPSPQRLGPQGQIINRSISSPPVTGPIAAAPIPGQPPPPTQPPSYRHGMTRPQLPGNVNLNSTFPPHNMHSRGPGPPLTASPPSGRPSELPMPYHGQAQYSQQVHPDTGLTPGSEPVSQKSSRGPSPVPTQNYDALEGQFSPSAESMPPGMRPPGPGYMPPMTTPTSPMPGFPGQPPLRSMLPVSGAPPMPGMPPMTGVPSMPQGPGAPPMPGVAPMSGVPQGFGAPPMPGMPHMSGVPQGLGAPPMPGMPPMTGVPSIPPGLGAPPMPGMPPVSGAPPMLPGGPSMSGAPSMPPTGPLMSNTAPPTSRPGLTGNRYPQMPSQPVGYGGQPPPPPPGGQFSQPQRTGQYQPGVAPVPPPGQPGGQYQPQPAVPGAVQPGSLPGQGYVPPGSANYTNNNVNGSAASLSNNFSNMTVQPDATRPLNLLQEKRLIPTDGVETSVPNLPPDYKKVNCDPDIFRCTLNAIPNSPTLLNKSRLPLGILIHPFKDLTQLPVIQSNVIVRCRSCRTYINPFVSFTDSRRWKCNLCYRNNELPDEFSYDPVSKTYGEPQRRPEIRSSTIEFIAPSEYMLRPPQAAHYLFVLDVSFNAIGTGYLKLFCETMLEELDRLPGDSRTQIGFMTFDTSLHFYNLQEGLSQPQMLQVSDIEDVFLPLPEGLLVHLQESKELVIDLLNNLPAMFEHTMETGSALGAALQAALKLMSPTGGRVSVFQTLLPTAGPGGLKNREDPNERAGKKISNMGPATDFYKKLALDCSAQQIAVDLFMLNSQYADLASITGISKYSGGCLHYFPGMHVMSNPAEAERFDGVLRRYLTRKIGFEAVMRIRCSRGISLHTFHGNFFVRSTDLLSLPNINPDAGFAMQMSIEDTIETNYFSFQAALLYTSSKGERRIRVHTLCIPVTSSITEVFAYADQHAIAGLLTKMAVDKSLSQSMTDARDALVNSVVDMFSAYGNTLTSSQRMGQLPCPFQLRLMPMYVLALLKYLAFRVGTSTKLDDRVNSLELCKNLPLKFLLQEVYPDLYPVHMLDERNAVCKGDSVICQPPLLHLSSANIDRHGAYLMDAHTRMYLWIGGAVSDQFCQEVFGVQNYPEVPDGEIDLPELENETSERLRTFIAHLCDQKPCAPTLHVIRDNSPSRALFLSRLIEDRGESTFSYYEFLQHLQKEVK